MFSNPLQDAGLFDGYRLTARLLKSKAKDLDELVGESVA